MAVGVKTHPITQLLNGVRLVGVSGFVVVFCEKKKFIYLKLSANN